VALVDLDGAFERLYEDGQDVADLFGDHVHYTFAGNLEMASILAGRISGKTVTADEEDARVDLLFTAGDEREYWRIMAERHMRPPFAGTWGNAARIAALARREMDVSPDQPRATAQISGSPWLKHLLVGRQFAADGRLPEADAELALACAAAPHRIDLRVERGMVQASAGHTQEGVRTACASGPRAPFLPDLLVRAGQELMGGGCAEGAEAFARKALEVDSAHVAARVLLAGAAARRGDSNTAEQLYRSALNESPSDAAAQEEWAVFLTLRGRFAEAEPVFLRNIAQHAERPEARLKYAAALIAIRRLEDAGTVLTEIDRLFPGYPPAQQLRHALR